MNNTGAVCLVHNSRRQCYLCLEENCDQDTRVLCMRCTVRGHKHMEHADKVCDVEELLHSDLLATMFPNLTPPESPSELTASSISKVFDEMATNFCSAIQETKLAFLEKIHEREQIYAGTNSDSLNQSLKKVLNQYQDGEIEYSKLDEQTKSFLVAQKQAQKDISSFAENDKNLNQSIVMCQDISDHFSKFFKRIAELNSNPEMQEKYLGIYKKVMIKAIEESVQETIPDESASVIQKNQQSCSKILSFHNKKLLGIELDLSDEVKENTSLESQLESLENKSGLKEFALNVKTSQSVSMEDLQRIENLIKKNNELKICSLLFQQQDSFKMLMSSIFSNNIHINIARCPLEDTTKSWNTLAKSLESLSRIRKFEFKISREQPGYFTQIFSESFLGNLSQSLTKMPEIQRLRVELRDVACFSQNGLTKLAKTIGNLNQLEKLSFSISGLKEDSFRSLTNSITMLSKLTSLQLRLTSHLINEFMYMELNDSFSSIHGLKELELNFSKFEFDDLSNYIDWSQQETKPEQIDVEAEPCSKLTGEYFNHLSQTIRNFSGLKKLFIIIEKDLSQVCTESYNNICKALESLGGSLEHLFLKLNPDFKELRQQVLEDKLKETLFSMKKLKTLFLDINNSDELNTEQSVNFLKQVSQQPNLRKIFVSEKRLEEEGQNIEGLCEAVKNQLHLTKVIINGTDILVK